MSSGLRALASATMLAGFLVVAAGQLALVAVPVLILLTVLPGSIAAQVGVPLCTATVGGMAYATWRALQVRRSDPAGVPVTRADAPQLWTLIDAAARMTRTPPPHTVTVVAEAAVTLDERTRLLGLLGGRRSLYLGLPLLQAWDVHRLRAVVAHEVAHRSTRLGRLAPLAYRGRVTVCHLAPRISRRNPAGWALLAYARLYRRLDAPLRQAQELAADRMAAEFAGPRAAIAVLRDLPLLAAAQRLFYAEYVGPGWRAGHVPDDIFGGFLRVLAARADDLGAAQAREPLPEPSAWDTHPPLAVRLAALSSAAEPATAAPGTPAPPGPQAGPQAGPHVGPQASQPANGSAADLVPDLPGLGRALQTVVFPPQGRTSLGWDEFFGAARTAEMQREADAALGTLSRATGGPVTHAGQVLDLAADGRLYQAAETVFPGLPPDETAARTAELITMLLALAALRSGAGRWRHSWTGTAELVAVDGSHLDLGEIAALVVGGGPVDAARRRAADLGIELSSAGQVGSTRTAAHAQVVSGLVNIVVGGDRTDLLIVDTGLLLIPGLPRSQNGSAKRRLAYVAAAADETERAGAVAGSRFIPYEDVVDVAQTRRTPKTWQLSLRDGSTLTVRAALGGDELPGGWAALDEAVAFIRHTRQPQRPVLPRVAGENVMS